MEKINYFISRNFEHYYMISRDRTIVVSVFPRIYISITDGEIEAKHMTQALVTQGLRIIDRKRFMDVYNKALRSVSPEALNFKKND